MKLAYGIYNNMTKTNDMKQKCVHCDGLGYFYNQATFQSEHCPHCEGKGYIDEPTVTTVPVEVNHDLGGPVEQPVVVEAPVAKPTKKTTKTVVETPVVEEPVVNDEPEVDMNSGGDVDGGA